MSTPPQKTFTLPDVFLSLASTANPSGFVPPPCLPQLRCLPPPLPLPPPPPPPPTVLNSNNWTNPTTTYTRVTVEDLFATNTVSSKNPLVWPSSSRSCQLNPNANPFQPAYQRSQTIASVSHSCQQPITNQLVGKSAVKSKQTTIHNVNPPNSESLPSTFGHNLLQNAYMSRGTVYFEQTTAASLVEEEEENIADSDVETGTSHKKASTLDGAVEHLKPVPKRDIARMMWETADLKGYVKSSDCQLSDLYDNAIRAIRERRAELQKRKEERKTKNNGKKAREQNESSDDIDPAAIVRDIVKCSHRKAVRERKLGADHIRKPFLYLMRYPCSMYLHDCCPLASSSVVRYEQINEATLSVQKDNGESAISNSDKGTKPIKGKSRSVSHTFIGKEITVDEIASAIIRMETDIFKKKGTSLHMTKAAVVSVIEEVQRYIIDQLKFDPVDFVSVRLRSTASSARLILKAQDRTPRGTGKIHRIRLEGAVKLCKLKDRNDKCLALTREKENGILTYEGKEVTVGVIVKAIAKMIREIYGKKPPFRISRSGLTEFITNKQEKIFEALKLKASNWTHSDKLEAKVPINAAEQPTSQNVVELPELKTAKAANARRKIKPIFIRRRLSSIENKKARRKKKPRPSVEQAESSRPRQEPLRDHPHRILNESCKEKLKTAHTDVERVDKETAIAVEPKAISTPTLVKDEQGDKWSADEGSNGTCNSDSSEELVAIRGKFTRCYLTRLNGFRGRTDRPLYSCSKNSIYRGRRHKMFISDMSPRKDKKISPKRKTKSVEEQMSSTNITEVTAQAVTDYSSIHDRMTAAPTSIVIRTVEKRSKKRGKKGWRKSWI